MATGRIWRARSAAARAASTRPAGAGVEAWRPDASGARARRLDAPGGRRDPRRRRFDRASAAALDPAVRAALQPGRLAGACDPCGGRLAGRARLADPPAAHTDAG